MTGDEETAAGRGRALSPALMARIFHQAALVHFNAVAEHLSVREASRRLNVAASAVSRQIAQLEEALGLTLFEREGRSLRLSPAGEVLFRHTRRLGERLELAVREIEMLRGLRMGTVRIASVESVALAVLPDLVTAFGTAYPRLQIEIAVTSSAGVIEHLAEETADIGLGFLTDPPRHVDVALRRDLRIGAVMAPDHPLADHETVGLGDCLRHPVALASEGISIRQMLDPFLEALGTMPPVVEVDSIRLMVQLALRGRYLALMPPIGAQAELAAGRLVFRPLAARGLAENRFAIMVPRGHGLQFAPAVFLEHAKAHFAAIALPGAV